jgi:hypothetical protein
VGFSWGIENWSSKNILNTIISDLLQLRAPTAFNDCLVLELKEFNNNNKTVLFADDTSIIIADINKLQFGINFNQTLKDTDA